MITLTELKVGSKAKVSKILLKNAIRRRIQDLGLIEGTCVECMQKSPSGDPAAYLIRGGVFALRKEDTDNILVN